jgi:hypothetical protein
MSYFNHAFRKSFLATGPTQTSLTITNPAGIALGTAATTVNGYLNTAGLPTYALNQLSATQTDQQADQYIGFFNAKTQLSVNLASMTTSACPLILAGSAIYTNDKIGPLTGGYQETNKSKVINPRYISRAYRVDPCTGNNAVVHVGSTYWTAGGGALTGSITTAGVGYTPNSTTAVGASTTTVTGTGTGLVLAITIAAGVPTVTGIVNPGKGYAAGNTVTIDSPTGTPGTLAVYTIATVNAAGTDPVTGSGGTACCKEFMCGETYTLRLDIKGSPNLRYLDHNSYLLASAYTGCCPDGAIAPTAVNSTDVMVAWAKAIRNSPIVSPFVQVVVQDEAGALWYAPGTSAAFLAANGADTWDNYVIGQAHTDGACAGLILNGAYVDTKFGDCSFQISDFYEKEPVRLYPSEVDLNGDPCAFDGICVVSQCAPLQAQGFGETILRDMILSEAYRQNFFATDIRIREITQGNQILSSVDRSGLYYRYVIQHNVPRFNNPSSTFDNDQYLLEIYSKNALAQLATDLEAYVEAAQATGCSATYETFSCTTCDTYKPAFPTVPTYNPFNTQGL